MLGLRRCDSVLIAGCEPLTDPQIVEISQLVKSYHAKPVIVTNGVGLNQNLVQLPAPYTRIKYTISSRPQAGSTINRYHFS